MLDRFTKVKKKILETKFSKLNEEQQKACFSILGPNLIVAGAGSGKTTVLTNRIYYMIKYGNSYHTDYVPNDLTENDLIALEQLENYENLTEKQEYFLKFEPVSPYNILAITFTNKAAREMKSRISEMLGDSSIDMWISTFHASCVRILKSEIDKIDMKKSFTIYDTSDSRAVIKECLKELNLPESNATFVKSCITIISSFKNHFISADECDTKQVDGINVSTDHKSIYKLYQQKLKSANAVDFDDILFYTVKIFKEFPDVLRKYQDKFRFILVDEYQDTNVVQYLLIRMLAEKYKNIFVVGDDDQSIYKFRGADIRNILNFTSDFENVHKVFLLKNYRSTQYILNSANSVIKNNVMSRFEGKMGLIGIRDAGTKIEIINPYNEYEEARKIADIITDLVFIRKEYKLSDIAIFYRAKTLATPIQLRLLNENIKHIVWDSTSFFDKKEVKDIISYLKLVNNPFDVVALRRAITEPKKGIGLTTIDRIARIASMQNISPLEVMQNASNYPDLSRAKALIANFCEMIKRLDDAKNSVSGLIEAVIVETNYNEYLKAEFDNPDERIENLRSLVKTASDYENITENFSLSGYLDNIALVSDTDAKREGEDAANLMTLHSSKGLEFKVVFIVGAEEQVFFPKGYQFAAISDMEEERRLFYVGITRAKDLLYMSAAKQRTMYGYTNYHFPLPFLLEIKEEYLKGLVEFQRAQVLRNEEEKFEMLRSEGVQRTITPKGNFQSFYKPEIKEEIIERVDNTGLKADDKVYHPVFKNGVVVDVFKDSGGVVFKIDFGPKGVKELISINNLEKID